MSSATETKCAAEICLWFYCFEKNLNRSIMSSSSYLDGPDSLILENKLRIVKVSWNYNQTKLLNTWTLAWTRDNNVSNHSLTIDFLLDFFSSSLIIVFARPTCFPRTNLMKNSMIYFAMLSKSQHRYQIVNYHTKL